MNPFEMVVLIVAVVTIGRVFQARYRAAGPLDEAANAPEIDQLREDVRRLKERVAVLERLATDGTAQLEREIEKLRDRD